VTRIAVTGGSGKAGRAVVQDLVEHGHDVLNVDRSPSPQSSSPESPIPFLRADVTDFGQTLEALSGGETLPGIEAVVHLAAIPSPAHAACASGTCGATSTRATSPRASGSRWRRTSTAPTASSSRPRTP